ncbi:MAG: redox-regulated ATPase YchF [Egibacteraceae bacterium]
MSLAAGIVGLPNVGKSTLFNAISGGGAAVANYAFATIEPNVATVPVPDPRLDALARLARSARVVPATVELVDIAGLAEGASEGEGLGNRFLAQIREVDALVHVVRCFDDADVAHVYDSIDPVRDVEIVETELLLADLEQIARRVDRAARTARSQGSRDPNARRDAELAQRLQAHLATGHPARTFGDDLGAFRDFGLLTAKPVLYVANVGEADLPEGNAHASALRALAGKQDAEVIVVAAETEAQITELPPQERGEFLADLGLPQSGLDQLVAAAFRLLGLITFLTAGPKEARAWTVRAGTPAPAAAREIHSDIERGFIRVEVIDFDDWVALGSEQAVKEAGRMRVEGRGYVIKDGDVVHYRFNV